jgi:hypothetical protein
MDLQSWIAVSIALTAGVWAAWTILRPIINEFRKKKSADTGCCGCGVKGVTTGCGKDK